MGRDSPPPLSAGGSGRDSTTPPTVGPHRFISPGRARGWTWASSTNVETYPVPVMIATWNDFEEGTDVEFGDENMEFGADMVVNMEDPTP